MLGIPLLIPWNVVGTIWQIFARSDIGLLGNAAEILPELRDGFALPESTELDLDEAGITTVIWAMGYSFDFSLVRLPVFDADGFPVQERGVTEHPGLYFVGMPWMPKWKSGLLVGVGEAAEHVAEHIARGREL